VAVPAVDIEEHYEDAEDDMLFLISRLPLHSAVEEKMMCAYSQFLSGELFQKRGMYSQEMEDVLAM